MPGFFVARQPQRRRGLGLLAKTYAATEQWPQALHAYEKAVKLLPQDASVLSGYAEALAIHNNRVLTPKHMELVNKALQINPHDIKELELAGISSTRTLPRPGSISNSCTNCCRLIRPMPRTS